MEYHKVYAAFIAAIMYTVLLVSSCEPVTAKNADRDLSPPNRLLIEVAESRIKHHKAPEPTTAAD